MGIFPKEENHSKDSLTELHHVEQGHMDATGAHKKKKGEGDTGGIGHT